MTAVALLVCVLGAQVASATTVEAFGPKLPVTLQHNSAITGHNSPGAAEHWWAYSAFEQEGRSLGAPISGTLSEVRLEYGSKKGMEVQIWTANAGTGAIGHLAGTMHLPATGGEVCGEGQYIESFAPDVPIAAGEILVLLNSEEKGGELCSFPEPMGLEGWFGDLGKEPAPEARQIPAKWHKGASVGVSLEGVVTSEAPGGGSPGPSTGGSTGTGSTGTGSGGTTTTSAPTPCGTATTCTTLTGSTEYKITIDPGGKVIYTKQPNWFDLTAKCELHGLEFCEGASTVYCSCSQAFGTISRKHAAKQLVVGRASFRVPAGQTAKVKVTLSPATRAILKRKHVMHATVATTLKIPGGRTATTTSKITVALKGH